MAMTRRMVLPSMAAVGAGLAAACSPLRAFNTVVPGDGGVRQVARAIAFGPGPREAFDAYAPVGAGPWPMLVFVYGGSWSSGRRQDYAWAARALAAQGFVVVVPDYRLVPEVRFPVFVQDVAAAIAKARAEAPRLGADPERIVLAGHSAGAYIAVLLALDPRYLRAAGVPAGVVKGAAGLAGPYDFYPWDAESAVNAFGSFPEPAQTQPITFARGDAPPLLLLTGDADETVRPRNSLRLADRITAAGGAAEVKSYPRIDHVGLVLALSRPFRGRAPVLADVAAFGRRVTG